MKKERLFLRFVMVMAILWSFSSCEKDDEKAPDFMDVDHTSFVFSGAAQDSFLMVSSSLAWKATTDVDWITLTPSSGTGGNVQVKVSVTENGVTEERTGKITIDGFEKKTIPVTQKQMSVSTLWETPTVEGELANGINIEGVTISIPFSGESEYVIPEITVTSSIGGISIVEMKEVKITKGVGVMTLTLQGVPEASGNAELTINGIPGLEENVITVPVVEPVIWGDMILFGTLRHKEPILYQYLEIVYENGGGRELELTFNSTVSGISLATTKYKLEEGKDTLRMMLKGTPEADGMAELIVSGLVHKGSDTVRTEIRKADVLTRYGNLTYEGPDLYVGEEFAGKLILPYEAVSDTGSIVYTDITALVSDNGVNVETLEEVVVRQEEGQIELDVSGIPSQTGEISFIFTGIPGLDNRIIKLPVIDASQFIAIWDRSLNEEFRSAAWTIADPSTGSEQPSLIRMEEAYMEPTHFTFEFKAGQYGGTIPMSQGYNGDYVTDHTLPKYWYNILLKPRDGYRLSLSELSFYLKTKGDGPRKVAIQYKIAHWAYPLENEPDYFGNAGNYVEIETVESNLEFGQDLMLWDEIKVDLSKVAGLQNVALPEDEGGLDSEGSKNWFLVITIVPYDEVIPAMWFDMSNSANYLSKPVDGDHFVKIVGSIHK